MLFEKLYTSRQRLLLGFVGALLLPVVALSGTGQDADAAGTITVSPENMNGWGFAQEVAGGTGQLVSGPGTAPAGDGSAELSVDATGRELLLSVAFAGTRF